MSSPEGLLHYGGWQVVDPQPLKQENPDTFWLPSQEQLDRLQPGMKVRAIIECVSQAHWGRDNILPLGEDGQQNLVTLNERMWFWIEDIIDEQFICVLSSIPCATHTCLQYNSRAVVPQNAVIDMDYEPEVTMEEDLAFMEKIGFMPQTIKASKQTVRATKIPEVTQEQQIVCGRHDVIPTTHLPFEFCFIQPSITPKTTTVFASRLLPHDGLDSGWMFYTYSEDLEESLQQEKFERINVNHLREHVPRLVPYIMLPYFWAVNMISEYEKPWAFYAKELRE